MALNRFQAVRELLGHDVQVKKRKVNGSTTMWWAECDCGFRSSDFRNSARTATGSAAGHLKRMADELVRESADGGVSLRASVSAALEDPSNVVIRASG